jgi:2-hydroxycyclohexanecarboxyl-CoA dehydrogenase
MIAGGELRPVLVTGAGSGIGRATALMLAERGHPVGVTDVDEQRARAVADELGASPVLHARLDVTDSRSVEDALALAERELGGLGGVVNSAGWTEHRPLCEQDDDYVARTLEINLAGALRVVREAVPRLRDWGSGRIVNIASDAGRTGMARAAAYSAAKGGILALTRSLAIELARDRITVNAVSPGMVDTPMLRSSLEEGTRAYEQLLRRVPLGRVGTPDDVAACACFLVSEAAGYVTGQTLSCNGGLVTA